MSPSKTLPPCPPHSSLPLHALCFVLSHPHASSLSFRDIAVLARTSNALKSHSDKALISLLSEPTHPSINLPISAHNPPGLVLSNPRALQSFAAFALRWSVYRSRNGPQREPALDSQVQVQVQAKHALSSRPPNAVLSFPLRALTIDIHPSQYHHDFAPAILQILRLSACTLTHLRVLHTDPLLAHHPEIAPSLAALSHLSTLAIHGVGPLGCGLLGDLTASLQEAQIDFDYDWVHSVICASYAKRLRAHESDAVVLPSLPDGSPAPTPALAVVPTLPDPVLLLEKSMTTLRTMRSSNAVIVTVADKIRYPVLRTLALRLAGVPTVIPLVHAFPALRELYVYTPFDGCGLRAPPPPGTLPLDTVAELPSASSPPPPSSPSSSSSSSDAPLSPRIPLPARPVRPPMPCIHATRETNRIAQVYSSFPPLLSVRGFAPGLYALGLTCPVRRLEVGSLTPRSEGAEEAWAVRTLLKDVMPSSLTIGLGRGWWKEGTMEVKGPVPVVVGSAATFVKGSTRGRGKASAKAKAKAKAKGRMRGRGAGSAPWKGKDKELERDAGRDGLTSLFGGEGAGDGTGDGEMAPVEADCRGIVEPAVWAGVSELVLRVEEPGRWEYVTHDILAMLVPLANTLTTFVLRWDRTSVPFDRAPLDDEVEDGANGSHARPSRAEAFAQRVAEQLPLLHYMFLEILRDAPPTMPISWGRRSQSERRFFRVERTDGGCVWLEPLSPSVGESVMAEAELYFVDQVRYE